jgi:Lon protease-like protein
LPNIVLFPGMPLPLHVFEPRYRKMLADALAGPKIIGMTLLKPGWEPHYQGAPAIYPIGCAGKIEQAEALPDGKSNILLRGLSRFRVIEELGGEPYRRAHVEPLPDLPGDESSLDSLRKQLLTAIANAVDGPVALVLQGELPHPSFVNALAQSLQLAPLEKQSLLDCDTVEARYRRLLEILEFLSLEHTWGKGKTVH